MKNKPTVYIETSIISYLAARPSPDLMTAACQQVTAGWWDGPRRSYNLATSALVVAESRQGEPQMAKKRLEHLRFSRREVSVCTTVLANHMRLHHLHYNFGLEPISRRSVYRFYRSISPRQSERSIGIDVVLLSIADYLGTYQNLAGDWPVYLSHAAQLLDEAYASKSVTDAQSASLNC